MKSRKPTSAPGAAWPLLTAVGAASFCAGSLLTWWFVAPSASPRDIQPLKPLPAFAPETTPPDTTHLSVADAARTMADWYYDHQKWAEAIARYERVIAMGQDTADVRTDLGNAYRYSNQPNKALEHYEVARRQNPQHANSLFNLATLYAQALNDPNAARTLCEQYLKQFPLNDGAPKISQFLQEIEAQAVERDRKVDRLLKGEPGKK